MKEETRETKTMSYDGAPACAYAEDLVSYLYGEADADAASRFEAHMQQCASCRKELSSFGQVRASIVDWRRQALGSLSSNAALTSAPVSATHAGHVSERKPSALAAIRQFFSLSPLWMRAATATLGVVFCALVALTVARYLEQPKVVTVERIVTAQPSEAELDEMIAERLRQKGGKEEAVAVNTDNQTGPAIVEASAPKEQQAPKANRNLKQSAAGQQNVARNRAPGLKISPQESREIARDLRLVAANEEDDLPRLSDLIEESNQ